MGAGCDGVGVDVSQTHAVTRKGFFQLWCPQAGHKTKRWGGYIYLADFGDILCIIFLQKDPSRDTGYVTNPVSFGTAFAQ
jgi:hypothetical protein